MRNLPRLAPRGDSNLIGAWLVTDRMRRLTDFAKCAGCAGKLSSQGVAEILRGLPPQRRDADVLVGTETSDDAGVYRISSELAIVQTIDFFPPLIDDPFQFGQIAAANALSDVYAMNGRPLTALNVVAFPDEELPLSVLGEILRGAHDRVSLAGAVTLGGHSLRDSEIKFGLSVTGLAAPSAVLTNAGAREGDALVLTKPLGTGFVTTANKRGECPAQVLADAVVSMIQLNAVGAESWRAAGGAHASTDVTGFGLAGHAAEMADGSAVTLEVEVASLPIIAGSEALATARNFTRASATNRSHLNGRMAIADGVDPLLVDYAFDPQTSGGLLVSIAPDRVGAFVSELRSRQASAAAVIGRVLPRRGDTAVVLR